MLRRLRTLGFGWLAGAVVACGLASAVACNDELQPHGLMMVPDAEPAADVPWLRATWADMQTCSGLHGHLSFDEILFYSVPRSHFMLDTMDVLGVWIPTYRQIYIALLNTKPYPDRTTRHEMMHALLYPMDSHNHPPEWFGPDAPCGDLMADGSDFTNFTPDVVLTPHPEP